MRRLADRSAPSIERFGFGGAAFGAIKIGYVTQALRHGGVVRPERLFENRHTAAIQRFRPTIVARRLVQVGEVVHQPGRADVVQVPQVFLHGLEPLGQGLDAPAFEQAL